MLQKGHKLKGRLGQLNTLEPIGNKSVEEAQGHGTKTLFSTYYILQNGNKFVVKQKRICDGFFILLDF